MSAYAGPCISQYRFKLALMVLLRLIFRLILSPSTPGSGPAGRGRPGRCRATQRDALLQGDSEAAQRLLCHLHTSHQLCNRLGNNRDICPFLVTPLGMLSHTIYYTWHTRIRLICIHTGGLQCWMILLPDSCLTKALRAIAQSSQPQCTKATGEHMTQL